VHYSKIEKNDTEQNKDMTKFMKRRWRKLVNSKLIMDIVLLLLLLHTFLLRNKDSLFGTSDVRQV